MFLCALRGVRDNTTLINSSLIQKCIDRNDYYRRILILNCSFPLPSDIMTMHRTVNRNVMTDILYLILKHIPAPVTYCFLK